MKYGLNLKFTKLEALEVGLWARTVQVACNEEDPRLPDKEQSKPPKRQQPQQTPTPINELLVTKQQIETGQKTSVAIQWSHSMPAVSPIIGERNGLQRQHVRQFQHGIEHVSIQGLCPTQVNIEGRFSQLSPCCPVVLTLFMFHIVSLCDRC